eukprot:5340698-Karenia_brevis.AAC.1
MSCELKPSHEWYNDYFTTIVVQYRGDRNGISYKIVRTVTAELTIKPIHRKYEDQFNFYAKT